MRDPKATRRSWQAGVVAVVAALLFVSGIVACGAGRPDASDGTSAFIASGEAEACTKDGATRACHRETGRIGDIVNCFSGTQTCMNGAWGACGGDGTISSLSMKMLASEGSKGEMFSGLRPLTVSATEPSRDAGSCLANPCNPYCNGIEVDADRMVPDGGFSSYVIVGTVSGPDSFPAGISGPKNAMGSFATSGPPANVPCTQGTPPADGKICSSDYCCAQYPVGGAANTCQPWATVGGTNPVADNKCAKAPGVDFTLGLACNDSSGQVHVPLCNRGTTDATSGTVMVAEYPGNPTYAGDLSGPAPGNFCNNAGDPSAYCLVNLGTKKIPAGKCIDVNVTAKTAAGTTAGVTCPNTNFSSGNRTMMVNPVSPSTQTWARSFAPAYSAVPEADYCNNYSFHPTTAQGGTCSSYGEQPPPPQSTSFTYEAECTPGFRIQWNQLSYNTQVPSESQVIFQVSAAPKVDGGVGTFSSQVVAANIKSTASPDPAICSMSGLPDGGTSCPKNLATLLGEPASHYEVLKVSVTEIAVTAIPVVYSWQVTFNCVPYE